MAAALCAVWLLTVALIVLWPTPVDRMGGGPLLRRVLALLYEHGLPGFVSYGVVESLANALMFVPFGLFWFILAPQGWRWAGPLAGLALSALIELSQLLLLPNRFATPWDVLANTLGALLGCAAGWGLLRARLKRTPVQR